MAVPTARTEGGGSKVTFASDATAGTPVAYGQATVETAPSGEATWPVAWFAFATHRQADDLTGPGGFATDGLGPVVCMAGIDDPEANDPVRAVTVVNEDPVSAAYGLVTRAISMTPGVAATNLGKADDAAHTTGDVGVMVLGVRKDAGGTLAGTDLDYAPFQFDASGNVRVNVAAGSSSGTEFNEDAVHSSGAAGPQILGVRQDADTSPVSATGDYHTLIFDDAGNLKVNIKAGSTAGTEFNEDAAHSSGAAGTLMLGVRRDADTSPVSATGDYHTPIFDALGNLKVNIKAGSSSGTEYTEDVATPNPIVGPTLLMERDDVLGGLTPSEGDWAAVRCNDGGALWVVHDGTMIVDGSGVTQPVSGTVTADAGTNLNTSALALETGGNLATVAGAVAAGQMQVDIVASLPAGTAAIGKLAANDGVDIGDVDVASIVPGFGATNLGKRIDDVVGGTDVGVAMLAKHKTDHEHIVVADGDYDVLEIDSLGALSVNPEQHHHFDEMNATTGWTVLGNDTLNLATTTVHTLGTLALTFDKVNGAANTVFAGIQKTVTTVDLGAVSPHDIIQTAFRVSSVADIDYAFVRLGTDSTNYNEWRIDVDSLTAGDFKVLAFTIGSTSFAGSTGNGWDPSAISYAVIGIAFGSETDTLSGIIFDEISYHTNQHNAPVIGGEAGSGAALNTNLQKLANKVVNLGAGNVGTGTLRVTVATDDVNLAAMKTALELLDNAVSGSAFQTTGIIAHDAAVSGNPLLMGLEARTTTPTAVADGDMVRAQADDQGRAVIVMNAPRDLVVRNNITLTSTTETTLIAAGGAGVFHDLTHLTLSNASTTAVLVKIRDDTGGSILYNEFLAPSGGGVVIPLFVPDPQGTANKNWTAQLGASVSSVHITAQAVKRL